MRYFFKYVTRYCLDKSCKCVPDETMIKDLSIKFQLHVYQEHAHVLSYKSISFKTIILKANKILLIDLMTIKG